MHFMLSSMSVVYELTTLMPVDGGENPTVEQVRKRAKWDNDDYVCRGLILNDFKNTLKHLKEELTLIELGSHLRIEESLRVQDSDKPKGNNVAGPSVVNMMEHNNSSRYNDNKGKRKHHDTRGNPNKKPKVTCWKCGKPGHLKKDCKAGNDDDVSWWVDSGAIVHVCRDRCWFKTFESLNDETILHIGNESTTLVHGRGCVDLMFSSVKVVSLLNVLHVPNIRKNLVSSSVLNNYGYKQVIESNKFVLSKHGVFISFGYLSNHMFRLNSVSDNIGSAFMSTSKLNDSILWHARLDEALDKFKVFKTKVELQQESLIKRFKTDRGGEYMNTMYFQSVGINHEMTAPYTPQQNGISERKNRVLKEMVNSMVPNKRNMTTLYEPWTKKKPNLNYLRVWGCRAVVRLPNLKLKTLGEKGIECIFVGYAEHSKAFSFYVIKPNDSVAINSIIELRDAIFDEHRVTDKIVQQSELRKSKRHRNPKDFGPEFQLYLIEGTRDEVSDQHSYCFNVEDDPKTFDEAIKSQDVAFWKEAINDEMDSIMRNNTWVLTDLPPSCKPLGINYFDTYAPVARISTIRLLIAMASIHNLIIHQMDVKTAFLNEELEEEAPKQWHQKFDKIVLSNGYLLNQADKCVYSKFDAFGKGVIICLYVDDMLIFGTDQVQVDLTKEFLSSWFSMKDMRDANVIFGIRIKHESNGISISQSHYIEKVLKKFNYSDCTTISTPLDTCEKLMPNRGLTVSQLKYSRVIGCLMYAITCTRPDIAFTVGKLSRYTSNPRTQHWQAIQRVLKYLKKTMDYRLIYSGYPSVVEGYTDASWISNTEDNSSTSGWVFLLGGGAISWAYKKQTCITGSTMEYEFVALAAVGKEAEWLKNLLLEISLWVKRMAPISIRCDSAATLAKAYIQMYSVKSRHLGVRHSMIRELITNTIEFVRSQQNLADHLMKGLARDLVIKSAEGMRLKGLKHMFYKSSQRCAWNLLTRRMKLGMDSGSYNIYELDMDTWLWMEVRSVHPEVPEHRDSDSESNPSEEVSSAGYLIRGCFSIKPSADMLLSGLADALGH
uniref:Zinc finger, CCHC-type n=1 Tax=Tanacetum cinerariifolium TaxID=118510 RepID=A0A6L2MIG3_TANCI|nr:zinc finger, CCHC-type [Tanacetum cinerariifolium]